MMTMLRNPCRLSGILVIAMLLSCGSGEPDSTGPGPLYLVLATPNTDDGIILLSISGGPVTSARSDRYQLAISGLTEPVTRIIVRGPLTDGVLGSITVPDRSASASYSVHVDEVAARQTYRRQLIGAYGVTLVSR